MATVNGFKVKAVNMKIENGVITFQFEVHERKNGTWEYLTTTKFLKENDTLELGGKEPEKPQDIGINVSEGIGVAETIG